MTTAEFAAPAASARAPERPDGAFLAGRRTRERRRRYVQGILISDAVAGLGAAALARSPVTGGISDTLLVLLVPPVWLATIALHRGYDTRWLFAGGEEYARMLRSGLSFAALATLATYASDPELARRLVLITTPALAGLGLLFRHLHRLRLRRSWSVGRCRRRVLAVGHASSVVQLYRHLRDPSHHGVEVVGACLPAADPRGGGAGTIPVPVHGSFDDVAAAVHRTGADAVVVLPSPEWEGTALRRLAWQLERHSIELIVATPLFDVDVDRVRLRPAGSRALLHVAHSCHRGPRHLSKEILDRVGAALALVLLTPLMIIVAALIRLTPGDRGPVLFRQIRVGRDGKVFPMYKFRTMHPDAEARLTQLRHLNQHDGLLFKLRDDPRVTPLGRWLRRYSIDELPQLFNVVRGHMSLVGPRPPLPEEVARYPADLHRRLAVKPGLTGLWQVCGRADLPWEEAMRLDLRYVENWSLSLDLMILLRTTAAVVRTRGAY